MRASGQFSPSPSPLPTDGVWSVCSSLLSWLGGTGEAEISIQIYFNPKSAVNLVARHLTYVWDFSKIFMQNFGLVLTFCIMEFYVMNIFYNY